MFCALWLFEIRQSLLNFKDRSGLTFGFQNGRLLSGIGAEDGGLLLTFSHKDLAFLLALRSGQQRKSPSGSRSEVIAAIHI